MATTCALHATARRWLDIIGDVVILSPRIDRAQLGDTDPANQLTPSAWLPVVARVGNHLSQPRDLVSRRAPIHAGPPPGIFVAAGLSAPSLHS